MSSLSAPTNAPKPDHNAHGLTLPSLKRPMSKLKISLSTEETTSTQTARVVKQVMTNVQRFPVNALSTHG